MGAEVFANGKEVSCKKSDDQSIAAMPDVCYSPPPPPVGPVPIPYPNFSQSSDTTDGTRTVQIAGQEVGMKNQSNYKTSKGDEAATRGLGMGIVTATIQGTTQFAAWSFDVMFEDANAIRFMDMTTHNHASDPANPPSVAVSAGGAAAGLAVDADCKDLDRQNQEARSNDLKPSAAGRSFTLTTALHSKPGQTPKYLKAATPGDIVKSGKRSGYAEPNPKTTMACTPNEYGSSSPRQSDVENNKTRNHTEPKLFEPIFQQNMFFGEPLGSLKMKIHHKDANAPVDAMPCESCRSAICAAVACELDIKLCNSSNQAVDPPCNNGQPQPEAAWTQAGLGPAPVTQGGV